MADDYPPFPGFRPAGLTFLRDLAAHNDRTWFKARKAVFDDEVQWPLRCLVADIARETARLDLAVTGDPKRSLFRIHRDTRFSKNKQPYKTHLGAVLSRNGDRKDPGGVYIHVQPGRSFLAAGYWNPDGPLLRAWRTRMADDPDAFLAMLDRLEAGGLTLDDGASLKRMPRGFDAFKDHTLAPFLKHKRFTVSRSHPDDALEESSFTARVVQMVRDVEPLLAYGWPLVDALRESP